jgi:hypothetical protein
MNNTASLLVLAFLAISFIQSAYDKLFYWKDNLDWLKGHFSKTPIKNMVPLSLGMILFLELISGLLAVVGAIQLFVSKDSTYGFYAGVVSCITLLFLLLGQRLAKDYDGARTIVIYFIPALLMVYWLG